MTQAQVRAEAPGVPVVQAEAIHKSFGENVVLDGIDLEVASGEALVVIGPSGSGKSTLLRCINLLEPIDSGRIFLEGEEITAQRRQGRPRSGSGSEWYFSSSTSFRI